jgi:hypothetical protein
MGVLIVGIPVGLTLGHLHPHVSHINAIRRLRVANRMWGPCRPGGTTHGKP